MKTETLEKIRNISEILFILFISILIILTAFVSLPVHAAEKVIMSSNVGNHTLVVSHYYNDLFQQSTYSIPFEDNKYFYAVSFTGKKNINGFDQLALYAYLIGSSGSPIKYNFSDSRISILNHNEQKDGSFIDSEGGLCSTLEMWFVPEDYSSSSERGYSYVTSLPFFESVNAMKNYCLTGDTSGLLNGGSIDNPDFEDTAYSFTGFTANNKMTATWTGTTERSYLKDQDVEEYVRVNYYFADKEAQDTIKQADAYPDEFATADKTLTIDVSGLKPDDENWFLRYIRITPCYRQAGLGAWGDFYHGEPSYVYFNQDGSIDRIEAPYIKGEISSDMERPVIVLHEAANGNPTESDYSYFEFNNAQSDYFFEMKGRWYTTNDFDLYRDKLVWKYKYSTLLKNNLSTWVSVSDNRSSVGRFQFDVLGKSSWDNLLSSYPVDDRNYIGGSYDLFNKITGYSDALETLKMLLKQPYSLFNGYEIYVRYFRYDENGGIQYSKWTHFYNNLADSEGSSGSRLDDLDNMYSENQSDKGLTDDDLSDLENGGNSRNDLDAVPKNNYDYSSLENATMNFFDMLTNFSTMLGQFPSMVAAVFGFLPSWLTGLIGVAIGAVIVCRFIGR